jgi:hypothetical protein
MWNSFTKSFLSFPSTISFPEVGRTWRVWRRKAKFQHEGNGLFVSGYGRLGPSCPMTSLVVVIVDKGQGHCCPQESPTLLYRRKTYWFYITPMIVPRVMHFSPKILRYERLLMFCFPENLPKKLSLYLNSVTRLFPMYCSAVISHHLWIVIQWRPGPTFFFKLAINDIPVNDLSWKHLACGSR